MSETAFLLQKHLLESSEFLFVRIIFRLACAWDIVLLEWVPNCFFHLQPGRLHLIGMWLHILMARNGILLTAHCLTSIIFLLSVSAM